MGYVPLFDNLTRGTLHGKWPDIGLWPVILTMADRFGILDVTPEYIAGVTGLDLEEVIACMARFTQPDPRSRTHSTDDEGRRLELLDDRRDWGWRVVNHAKYREKARLLSRDSERTANGMDAARKRRERGSPPKSPEVSPSDGDGDGDGVDRVPTEPCRVSQVFDHWKVVHNHPNAKMDAKRKRVISVALKIYTPDELKESISGYLNSPHHMGENDKQTKYDDIALLLRDAAHVDAGLNFARHTPSRFSKTTRENIDRTADWVPPEMRQ